MATVSIDFDSKGDVELVLKEEDVSDPASDPAKTALPGAVAKPKDASNFKIEGISLTVKQLRIRVSSVKLIASSSYFRAMLEGTNFREAQELKEHGHVKIDLSAAEDNPKAMIIALAILYEDSSQLPATVNMVIMNELANLVDKYQWHALINPRATAWLDKLAAAPRLVPFHQDPLMYTWLWMGWVFGNADVFRIICKSIQLSLHTPIRSDDVDTRLPTKIIEAINERRQKAFLTIDDAVAKFKATLSAVKTNKVTENVPDYHLRKRTLMKYAAVGWYTLLCSRLRIGSWANADHIGMSLASLRQSLTQAEPLAKYISELRFSQNENTLKETATAELKAMDVSLALQATLTKIESTDYYLTLGFFQTKADTEPTQEDASLSVPNGEVKTEVPK